MVDEATKQIEVVFAMPGRCWRESVRTAAEATAEQAAIASGLMDVCHEQTGLVPAAFGVFGRKVTAETVIGDGQRLELYRPLTADPRERRRRRAAQAD